MIITKISLSLIVLLSITLLTHISYANEIDRDSLLLQKEIGQAAQKHISNPVSYIFNKYKKLNTTIDLNTNSNLIEENSDHFYIPTDDVQKPSKISNQQWQDFIKFTKSPIPYSYTGGGIIITFFELDHQGYIGLLLRVPNMGSAAGEEFLIYVYNKSSREYILLTKNYDLFFIGQKGDNNDIFSINFKGKHYLVYRNENDFTLCDAITLSKINNHKEVKTLHFTYNYQYSIKKILNKNKDTSLINSSSFNDFNINFKDIIPILNERLKNNYEDIDKNCPFDDNYARSSYVDQWVFTLKYNNICYYNQITCSLNDSDSECELEVYPGNSNIFSDNNSKKIIFELKKEVYLKTSILKNG